MGALQGDLGVLGLTVVLPSLVEGRRRGTLTVSLGGEERTFFLDPPAVEVLGAAARRLGPIEDALLRRGPRRTSTSPRRSASSSWRTARRTTGRSSGSCSSAAGWRCWRRTRRRR